MRRWSKLQKELYNLIVPGIRFQIHCAVYPMRNQYGGGTNIPRYWITLGRETIFDYPRQFMVGDGKVQDLSGEINNQWPYTTDISDISRLIREYIDTPKEELMTKVFVGDVWGLVDIFRAADKRIGRGQLMALKEKTEDAIVHKVIEARFPAESKIVKAGLNDFFEKDEYIWCEVSQDQIEMYNKRPFHIQMSDIFGMVDKVPGYFEKWKNNGCINVDDYASVIMHLNLVHELCFIAYSNPNFTDDEKDLLRAAQWEQYDIYLWGNKCKNTSKSVMNWFNKYMNNIYEMMAREELGYGG